MSSVQLEPQMPHLAIATGFKEHELYDSYEVPTILPSMLYI
ncbi:MAG TPA: hypothetical protein VE378_03960 [Nitrososphaeraceae archaeon]|nr:hypothetical protein [Nitrososphaeraceae archaeon]